MQLRQQTVEALEARLPDIPILLEPGGGLGERFPFDAARTPLRVLPHTDQASPLEHLEVFGDRRLSQIERLHQRRYVSLTKCQPGENRPPRRIRQSRERQAQDVSSLFMKCHTAILPSGYIDVKFLFQSSWLTISCVTNVPSRRAFLVATTSWLAVAALGSAAQDATRTRLVLLGTAGGPTPKAKSSQPAQAIVVGDRIYLVDCGDGVARQLALAKLAVQQLRAVFITHQHSDHNAGYGPLFLLGWAAGLSTPVDAYGPPPLTEMTARLLEAYRYDVELRIADEGRPPLAPLVRPHEITEAGEVFKDDRVRVTAALNDHPPIRHSFAFRFDTADRSIVISGDTRYSENVVKLAQGADVLVHEVLSREFWERPNAPQPPSVIRHILASHTDAADAGRVAAAAGVRTLVLSHFVPTEGPDAPTDDEWLAAARRHFKGRVVMGRDLLEL